MFHFFRLHDRKMAVLGLCILLDTPPSRPAIVNAHAPHILPSALMLFQGLASAYESK